MTARTYTRTETLALVQDLDGARLASLVETRIVMPADGPDGPVFAEADLARLQMVCDLCAGYALDADALAMVVGLIDQLHTMRGDMRALLAAVAAEPDEVRARLHAALQQV